LIIFKFDDHLKHTHFLNMDHVAHVGFYPTGTGKVDGEPNKTDMLRFFAIDGEVMLFMQDKDARRVRDELEIFFRENKVMR